MKLIGNYQGDKILEGSDEVSKGKFDKNHPMAYGVNNLYEGITICHPINVHDDFKIFAQNTEGNPLILYAEANDQHGRIVLDCGFTKNYDGYWQKAG